MPPRRPEAVIMFGRQLRRIVAAASVLVAVACVATLVDANLEVPQSALTAGATTANSMQQQRSTTTANALPPRTPTAQAGNPLRRRLRPGAGGLAALVAGLRTTPGVDGAAEEFGNATAAGGLQEGYAEHMAAALHTASWAQPSDAADVENALRDFLDVEDLAAWPMGGFLAE